jgi:hypothetical protein
MFDWELPPLKDDTEVTPTLFPDKETSFEEVHVPHQCYLCNKDVSEYPKGYTRHLYGTGASKKRYCMTICEFCFRYYCDPIPW